LNPKVAEDPLAREEIVAALTGPIEGQEEGEATIEEMVARVSSELDRRSAVECARVLGDCVFQDRPRTRDLEALVILGLAHPRVFRRFALSISSEGRRLALMLENDGRVQRARELLELLGKQLPEDRDVQQDLASLMRRTGGVDQFIDRCLQRAEREVMGGNYMDAISWLQEVLLHDQSRRDVARMIRDLRYEEMENRQRRRRRNRLVAFAVVLTALLGLLGVREFVIHRAWAKIPDAPYEDPGALRARMASIDALVDQHVFWLGFFAASDERRQLQKQLDGLQERAAERKREATRQLEQRVQLAETARTKGRLATERGDMREALQHFRTALELCTDDWEHRERVQADVEAIESWLEGQRD
jgi:tetratricopeptide (TPR) repeat protein